MIIDLSFLRDTVADKYHELLFNYRIKSNNNLNSYGLPLALFLTLNLGTDDKSSLSSNLDALMFGGCEVLRQINNYYILYKK